MSADCFHVFSWTVNGMTMSTLPQQSVPITVTINCQRCGHVETYARVEVDPLDDPEYRPTHVAERPKERP